MFGSSLFNRLVRRVAKVEVAAVFTLPNGLEKLREMTELLTEVEEARAQIEKQLRRKSAMLAGINKVLRGAVVHRDVKATARICLAVAEELTASKFGFIGMLNEKNLFTVIAISNPGWDACKMPDSNAVRLIENMPIRGVDRSTLRDKESRIVNDPASHPDHMEPPEGHPKITGFLGVPLKRACETIGMIGLANKEEGYELIDQETIETLSVAFVEALMSKER